MAEKEVPFYNIDSAVGPGCPNKRTDVMLVQFFLRQIYGHPTKKNKPAGSPIEVNGIFDSTTAAWIKHYQNDMKGQGKPIFPDGRIDRANGAQFSVSSVTKTHYTIGFLNAGHCERFRQEHNHLERHPLVPPELKADLARAEPVLR